MDEFWIKLHNKGRPWCAIFKRVVLRRGNVVKLMYVRLEGM